MTSGLSPHSQEDRYQELGYMSIFCFMSGNGQDEFVALVEN